MDEFAHIWRVVEPKQRRYDNAKRALENSQRVLREAMEKLQALQERINELKEQYAEQVLPIYSRLEIVFPNDLSPNVSYMTAPAHPHAGSRESSFIQAEAKRKLVYI